MDSGVGKMSNTCIAMAIHDFYEKHNDSTTEIRPHFRDSKQDNVHAASVAIDLMKNVQVSAILGPMTSSQADFVIDIGKKTKVPVISPATSPSLSPNDNPYFIRSAHSSNPQLKPLAELIEYFNWREVVLVYEDDEYGRGLVPCFCETMLDISTKIMYQAVIHHSASDDWILGELYKLKTMQTRVFVVHALTALASRFFKKVDEAGMMEEGYVWIITEVLTSRLHSLDHADLDSMHGVLGVKSYIPRSNELIEFKRRWKREFRARYPDDDETELDMFGIWWYDVVSGLAMALEKVGNEINTAFRRNRGPITDLDAIGTSEMGPRLVPWIRNLTFKGLSGDFHIVDGQLESSVYQIVNIIGTQENPIGFWTHENGISKKLNHHKTGLRAITWPGDGHVIPKGWETPTSHKNVLKVGVPAKSSFVQFVDAKTDPETQQVIVTGFCVDVFNAVVSALPYAVKHEFIPFVTPDGTRPAGSYTDLIQNLSIGIFDAVVGDVTILADRWDYVDFTFPYTEAGISMIVPFVDERKSSWIFVRPLEKELWITTGAFFIYTGLVVWVLEHRVNKEFRGARCQQVGIIFWFSFSTLVYAHTIPRAGVSAIMDELPYIRLFLATYCNKYTMTNFTYKTAGFGFAFPKGSPRLHDVSKAVLQVTEERMMNITNQWFVEAASCDQQNGAKVNSGDSFKGLFLIAGLSSTSAILIFVFMFLYQNREILASRDSVSRKLAIMAKTFDMFKDDESRKTNPEATVEEFSNDGSPGILDEPGIPAHDTIQVLEITTS
ncbi:hypothetical protein L1987_49745 [Smallanthus sonchifolius]|uniref:Uncharacterized protein n=1 Tax=Smallanthus sonchifolius TaxID=185202 RepID=A0ACB9FW50_9ASTR|nr:hypothetical protein L1987_49745 [Smallanthus sonchifolius]